MTATNADLAIAELNRRAAQAELDKRAKAAQEVQSLPFGSSIAEDGSLLPVDSAQTQGIDNPWNIHNKKPQDNNYQQNLVLASLDSDGDFNPVPEYGVPQELVERDRLNPAMALPEIEPALQGRTLNTSDEMRAGIGAGYEKLRSLFTGEDVDYNQTYDAIHDGVTENLNTIKADNPKAALVAELVGGLTTGIAASGAIIKNAPSIGGKITKLAGSGAVMGGISGAGGAERGKRDEGAFYGSLVGGIASPILGGLGNLASKAINPLFKNKGSELIDGLTPGQLANKQDFARVGIHNPTKGQLTSDVSQQSIELNLAKANPDMRNAFNEQNTALLNQFDDLVSRSGSNSNSRYDAGTRIIEGVKISKKAAHKLTGQAYKKETQKLTGTQKLQNFKEQLDIASDHVGDIPAIASINNMAKRLHGEITPVQAENLRKAVSQKMQKLNHQDKRILKPVLDALQKDSTHAFGSEAYESARKLAHNEFRVFDNAKVVGAILKGKVAPDDIIRNMVSKGWKKKDIYQLKRALSKQAPDAFKDVQAGVMRHISEVSKVGQSTLSDGSREVSGAKMKAALASIGRDKIEAIYGKDGARELGEIATIIERVTNKRGVNSSNTATADWNLKAAIKKLGSSTLNFINKFPAFGQYLVGTIHNSLKGSGDAKIQHLVREALNPLDSIIKSNAPPLRYNGWLGSGLVGVGVVADNEWK